jgi:hypothetical protein
VKVRLQLRQPLPQHVTRTKDRPQFFDILVHLREESVDRQQYLLGSRNL